MVIRKSLCLFCSLGCGLAFRMKGEEAIAIDYDGPICPRGHYNFELINHPERLTQPLIGKRPVKWEEAVKHIKDELKQFKPEEVAVAVAPILNNEAAAAAVKLANGLGTTNLSVIGSPADLEAYSPEPGATLDEIENAEALLIVGDLLTRSAVLSKRVNKVKYGARGNKIIVVDPNRSHTAWFATRHLQIESGTEARALTGDFSDFQAAKSGVIVIAPSERIKRNDLVVHFTRQLAAASPNKKVSTFYEQGNTFGFGELIAKGLPYGELLGRIDAGEIKAMIMIGDDLAASSPELAKKIRHLRFTVLANFFAREQTDETLVTLPLAGHLETGGSVSFPDGRRMTVEPVVPKVGAKSVLEIAELLGAGDDSLAGRARPPLDPAEVKDISVSAPYPPANITHFGNNNLVKRFFWYKVNNE